MQRATSGGLFAIHEMMSDCVSMFGRFVCRLAGSACAPLKEEIFESTTILYVVFGRSETEIDTDSLLAAHHSFAKALSRFESSEHAVACLQVCMSMCVFYDDHDDARRNCGSPQPASNKRFPSQPASIRLARPRRQQEQQHLLIHSIYITKIRSITVMILTGSAQLTSASA